MKDVFDRVQPYEGHVQLCSNLAIRLNTPFIPAGKCTYNVHTLYVQACTYGFGTDNIRNESFLDVRVRTYNVRTLYVQSNTKTELK